MAMTAEEIETLIRAALPHAQVEIRDLAGDGEHYAATVTCASFAGKSRLARQRAVYDAFGGRMGTDLHALQLTTAVPE
jgi:stress-induced morphogen